MDHEERHDLHEIAHWLKEISHTLRRLVPRTEQPATTFSVTQLSGGTTMAKLKASFPGPVVGTVPGTTSTFGLAPVGADGNPGLLQAGSIPSYTSDDPNVGVVGSADGSSVATTLPLADTQGSAPAGSAKYLTCRG